jgi:ureidoglycolate amidohydrolase
VTVDADRLAGEIEALAQISDTPYPSVTRVLFTGPDMRGRDWMVERCEAAGLDVRFDAVGNLFARWEGAEPELAAVATGSHTDAIPNAGRFDGVVGVLGGLEAIRSLKASGLTPRRSIELIVFTAEEPTRFGIGCVGSRMMSGQLDPERAAGLTDADGVTLEEARLAAGYAGALSSVRPAVGHYRAFVELHIEQGPLLERDHVQVGVVTAIAAPATLRVDLTGPGGHAGAVLMADRADPMVAAAELVSAVDAIARSSGGSDTVATCGLVDVFPGAVNSIPREVRLSIDVRDTDGARRDRVVDAIRAKGRDAAARRGVGHRDELLNADPPATCAPEIVAQIEAVCAEQGVIAQRMISRAYHDSLFMAQICPTGMIFIPCRGGVSHRPDEFSSPEDIARGAAVLAGTLANLAA